MDPIDALSPGVEVELARLRRRAEARRIASAIEAGEEGSPLRGAALLAACFPGARPEALASLGARGRAGFLGERRARLVLERAGVAIEEVVPGALPRLEALALAVEAWTPPLERAAREAIARGARPVWLAPPPPRPPRAPGPLRLEGPARFEPAPDRARGERPLVVYLAWGGAGIAPCLRFAREYRAKEAGVAHDLLVVRKGLRSEEDRAALARALEAAPHLVLDDGDEAGRDLGAFREALRRHERPAYCFAGTFARPLADGWLALLLGALSRAGLAGASGSWESGVRRDVFPNPHVRTTCFAAARATLERLSWPPVRTRRDAWALEHGPRSLTAQVRALGLGAVTAGRDGRIFAPEEWPESGGYLSGAQENLLVGDQRASLAAALDPEGRLAAARRAFGGRARTS